MNGVAATQLDDLCGVMGRAVAASRTELDDALHAAWQIGDFLCAEKRHLRRTMGRGAWSSWPAANFPGSPASALRCMRLSQTARDANDLRALSLRQAYFYLGVATEPKRQRAPRCSLLPAYLRHAHRLLLSVRMRLRLQQMDAEARRRLCVDLKPLRDQLRALFGEKL
jgi:hypothetical protein